MTKVVIGRLGAPYGVKGWIKVNSFMELEDDILKFTAFFVEGSGGWQKVEVNSIKPHGKVFVAKLAGLDDRDAAKLFTNCNIAIARDDLPDLDAKDHYWVDLLNLKVINKSGQEIGVVTDIFATGANDVLVVQNDDMEHLIPYIMGQSVLEVDQTDKIIRVDWNLEED